MLPSNFGCEGGIHNPWRGPSEHQRLPKGVEFGRKRGKVANRRASLTHICRWALLEAGFLFPASLTAFDSGALSPQAPPGVCGPATFWHPSALIRKPEGLGWLVFKPYQPQPSPSHSPSPLKFPAGLIWLGAPESHLVGARGCLDSLRSTVGVCSWLALCPLDVPRKAQIYSGGEPARSPRCLTLFCDLDLLTQSSPPGRWPAEDAAIHSPHSQMDGRYQHAKQSSVWLRCPIQSTCSQHRERIVSGTEQTTKHGRSSPAVV